MRKIIIVFDGNHFSNGAFDFVCKLNEKAPVLVTGVFLPAVDYGELLYSFGGMVGPLPYTDIAFEDKGIVLKNIEHFKSQCIQNGLEYRVHADLERHVISEIKLESRFADLLVLSSNLFYENIGADSQHTHTEHVLHNAECPVLLLPEKYQFPENVIFAYDGSESSVYAMKQFSYLFPEFANLKTLIVSAGLKTKNIPNLEYLEEFATCHFKDLTINKLEIDPAKYFNTWVQESENAILATGAYGRSAWSELIKKSFIAEIIKNCNFPIFIAHK